MTGDQDKDGVKAGENAAEEQPQGPTADTRPESSTLSGNAPAAKEPGPWEQNLGGGMKWPGWWQRLTGTLFVICLFLLAITGIYFGVQMLLVVFAGILFGVLLHAVAAWFQWLTRAPYKWCLVALVGAIITALCVTGWIAAPKLVQQGNELIQTLPGAMEKIKDGVSRYQWGQTLVERVPEAKQMVTDTPGVLVRITNAFAVTGAVLTHAVVVFFLGVFLAFNPRLYKGGVLALVPRSYETRACEVLTELGVTLSRWLLGQLMSMVIVFVMTTAGLLFLRVDFAIVLGLVAGLLAFVPNIGPVASVVPALLVGLNHSPAMALKIAVLYIVVQTIESNIFDPIIQKRMVYIAPALLLSVQLLMALTLGLFALMLATPLAAVVLVMVKMLYIQDVLGKDITLPGE